MPDPADAVPRTLVEPTTGRPVLMAPMRQQRPIHTAPTPGKGTCPFCPGAEHETPPESAAMRALGTLADQPGWNVRCFPNKYPAGPHHEVIAEGNVHCTQPGELDETTWADAVHMWQHRIRALELRGDVRCAFLFKNVGALAGASIAHNHSQVLGLPDLPPRLQLELSCSAALAHCPWCADLAAADREGRTVFRSARHAVIAPAVPRLPHETLLLPLDCADDFLATDAASLASALHALFRAVQHGLAAPAFNLWLHRVPGARFHWHLELQPRTGQMAGLELGGDMYINSVPPAQSAARLRGGLHQPAAGTP